MKRLLILSLAAFLLPLGAADTSEAKDGPGKKAAKAYDKRMKEEDKRWKAAQKSYDKEFKRVEKESRKARDLYWDERRVERDWDRFDGWYDDEYYRTYPPRRPIYPEYRFYDDYEELHYYRPRIYNEQWHQGYHRSRNAEKGARIGARIGGAIGGSEGAAIGADIGRDVGIEIDEE